MKTQKQKMVEGELYHPTDPELTAARTRARELCQALNSTPDGDQTTRRRLVSSLFGPAVQIYTPLHPLNAQQRRLAEYGQPVQIGEDVWVGGGAIILPGVKIGSRSVIGAGSVVTRDIPDDVFAAGNPCKVIRRLE